MLLKSLAAFIAIGFGSALFVIHLSKEHEQEFLTKHRAQEITTAITVTKPKMGLEQEARERRDAALLEQLEIDREIGYDQATGTFTEKYYNDKFDALIEKDLRTSQ